MNGKCFKEPIFHGIVEGRITQFREIMKPQPKNFIGATPYGFSRKDYGWDYYSPIKPRFKIGETLYLKEPYRILKRNGSRYKIAYQDGYNTVKTHLSIKSITHPNKWCNKLYMSKDFARYFIEITGVNAERLQDISDENCIREGIIAHYGGFEDGTDEELVYYSNGIETDFEKPQQAFAALIDKIQKGAWERNEFYWAYEFKLIK